MSVSERDYLATPEPQLSADAVRLLRGFQDSLRNRVYNLIEDRVRETGNAQIGQAAIHACILKAIRELTSDKQLSLLERAK